MASLYLITTLSPLSNDLHYSSQGTVCVFDQRKGGKSLSTMDHKEKRKRQQRGQSEDCQLQQMQEAPSLREYGYLLKHENVFLAEEEV